MYSCLFLQSQMLIHLTLQTMQQTQQVYAKCMAALLHLYQHGVIETVSVEPIDAY